MKNREITSRFTGRSQSFPYEVSYHGVPIGVQSKKDADLVASALDLYERLAKEFKVYIEPEPEEVFTEYLVGSSFINKVGYNRNTGNVVVYLQPDKSKPEKKEIYYNVPSALFNELVQPTLKDDFSVGKVYNRLFKGNFRKEDSE